MRRRGTAMLGLVTLVLLGLVLVWPLDRVQASNGWVRTSLHQPMDTLLTPDSGALFAHDDETVFRSDDAGESWREVTVPSKAMFSASRRQFAVNPNDHTTMFTSASGGLHRTTDDAFSWALVLPSDLTIVSVAVSQADPRVVWVGSADLGGVDGSVFRLHRSRDGGSTWDLVEELGKGCFFNVNRLFPHPTDAQRVVRTASCTTAGMHAPILVESRDQGRSWSALDIPSGGSPDRLVGGAGALPTRRYLELNHRGGSGDRLYRSDDDGASWHETTAPWAALDLPDSVDEVWISGLDLDPIHPERLYVGLMGYHREPQARWSPHFRDVVTSEDGGSTWASLGWSDLAGVFDVAVGVDGRNLYVASTSGVWRLGLDFGP